MATEQEIRQRIEEFHRPRQDLMVFIIAEFQRREGVNLSEDHGGLVRLDEQAWKACWKLKLGAEQLIDIPFAAGTPNEPKHLKMFLRRRKKRQADGSLA